MLTSRYDEAFRYAHDLHRKQTRKGTPIPYISHLMSVSAIVVEHGGDEDQAIGALLHDAAEDQGALETLDEIRRRFGDAVAEIVYDCTSMPGPSRNPNGDRARKLENYRDRTLFTQLAYASMFCCMTRIARIVAPGLPHHVTQRGNHRAAMFFEAGDSRLYRDLLAAETRAAHVAVWAWVLMPNHVHLILVPTDETGLAGALGRVHRRYAAYVNARARRTGHLVQERFGSVVMDEAHLMAGLRYVALNPVRARLVAKAED